MNIVGGNPSTRAMRIKGAAAAFALWRAASSVKWDCTIAAAAREAGISAAAAHQIARAKGWTRRFNQAALSEVRGRNSAGVRDTVTMMRGT
jgi:hypothetical protein